jgi:SAM-dependent methyltransferase
MRSIRQYIEAALRDFSKNGLLWVLKKAGRVLYMDYKELQFDLRWGVNTRRLPVDASSSLDAAEPENLPYEAISPDAFEETMRSIANFPLPKLFFDMGCGKGRVLLLASQYGFKHIVGIEIDPRLKREAERNIDRSKLRKNEKVKIEVVQGNAKDYLFPDEDAVIFFYNPFKESTMAETLKNIRRTAHQGRKRYIIYQNAVHESLLSDPQEYTLLVKEKCFSVYRLNL